MNNYQISILMVAEDAQTWIDQANIPVGSSIIVQEVSTPIQGVVQEDGSISVPDGPTIPQIQEG